MTLASARLTRWVLGALVVVAGAAAFDAVVLWRANAVNAEIASGRPIADAPGQPPELRFAAAYAMAPPLAASGARDAALNRYRALQEDPRVGAAARYNGANLLVRQAVEVQAGAQPGQAIALIELAKEAYRDVLREDSSHWDARYNLERAQRLLPDPSDDDDVSQVAPEQNHERAATTMRGYSPGLP